MRAPMYKQANYLYNFLMSEIYQLLRADVAKVDSW